MREEISSVVTMESEFPVPSHLDLHLDTLQCRFPECLKMYKSEQSRKSHELVKHRFVEHKGRTVSPVNFKRCCLLLDPHDLLLVLLLK